MKNTVCKPRGFTLVEMMVVVAIIGILMVVALPAYNNYSTKSKFTEVVLATAPTKTAIATCAGTGDCVSGGAISLTTGAGSSGSVAGLFVPNGANDRPGQPNAFAILYAGFQARTPTATPAELETITDDYYEEGLFMAPSPSSATQYCISASGDPCFEGSVSVADFNKYYAPNAALIAAAGTGAPANLPCVGPAGTGCSPPTKYAASVSYDAAGDITATAQATSGLNGETFVLIPQYSGGRMDWAASGSCKTRAGGALC